jgi:hypothetical protein
MRLAAAKLSVDLSWKEEGSQGFGIARLRNPKRELR